MTKNVTRCGKPVYELGDDGQPKLVPGVTCCLEAGHDDHCDREATAAELQAARDRIAANRTQPRRHPWKGRP